MISRRTGTAAVIGVAVRRSDRPAVAQARDEIWVGDEGFAKRRQVNHAVIDELFGLCQIEPAGENEGTE